MAGFWAQQARPKPKTQATPPHYDIPFIGTRWSTGATTAGRSSSAAPPAAAQPQGPHHPDSAAAPKSFAAQPGSAARDTQQGSWAHQPEWSSWAPPAVSAPAAHGWASGGGVATATSSYHQPYIIYQGPAWCHADAAAPRGGSASAWCAQPFWRADSPQQPPPSWSNTTSSSSL